MNAVIYARYSSHSQREESIEGQIRRCKEFAEQNNITIIGEYIDRALTGKTDKRESFQRMIRDSERGKFEAVIMYTLDRFARNRFDSAHYKAKLKKNGVKIFYTEQSISDEPEGIILESVLEGMAEYYSENLSRGVKRGMRENVLKSKFNGGFMLFGYKKSTDGKYEINPATAPIVKEIFDLYINGKSLRQIADIMNEKGYKTAKNKPFRVGSVSGMLCNKKYIGVYEYNDIIIENGIPPIIDKEIFNKAQEAMKKHKRTPAKAKASEPYLLTGKVFCGHCGSTMFGESGKSHTGTIYHYYKCSDRKKGKFCDKKSEKKEWLEKLVIEETIRKFANKDTIRTIAKAVSELANKEFNDKSRLLSLQEDLKNTQKAISNLLSLVEKGIDTDDVGSRLLDLNIQKKDILKQIDVEEIKKPFADEDRIAFFLENILLDYAPGDIEKQQRIIDTLVDKIFVFDNDGGKKIVITYNTSSSTKSTLTFSDIKSSDFDSCGSPIPTIPNLFVTKDCFGLVIKITE